MIIRTAEANDIPQLAGLMGQLGYPTTTEQFEKRFAQLSSYPDYAIFVVELDGKLVGMAGLINSLFFENDGSYVRIAAFVVDKNHRRKGIGEKLIQRAEAWAREMDAIAVTLNSGNREERMAAHQFYEKMGYVNHSSGFSKRLS